MSTSAILKNITWQWALRAFGYERVTDKRIRALRLTEEVVELAQILGVDQKQLHKLVDVVYSRPVGQVHQEIGGIMVTLCVLCAALDINPDTAFEMELLTILNRSPEHFEKRNKEKMDLGLD